LNETVKAAVSYSKRNLLYGVHDWPRLIFIFVTAHLIIIIIIIIITGTISKCFRKYVSTIPGNHEVKELQKTAILGTAHILRKVLM
jgi:hypothetical protein